MGALVRWVPDIGDIIQLRHDDYYLGPQRWRVTGFMRTYTPPPRKKPTSFADVLDELLEDQFLEKGKTRLQWCLRSEAEYVTGSGVAGCCHLISDIIKVGTVNWSRHQIEEARIRSYRHILF